MPADIPTCKICKDTKKSIFHEPDGRVIRAECPECVGKKYSDKIFLDSGIPSSLLQFPLASKDSNFNSFLERFSAVSIPKTIVFMSSIPDITIRHAALLVKTAIGLKMTSRLLSLSSLFSKLGESELPWPTTLAHISDSTDVFVLYLCREIRGSVSKETDLFYSLYRRRRLGMKPLFIFSELDFPSIHNIWGEQLSSFFRKGNSDIEFVTLRED